MRNIWILTEERPKNDVIRTILSKVASDNKFQLKITGLRIIPILLEDGNFSFIYKAERVSSSNFENVFIKIVSGSSSFVDFLVFIQESEPNDKSKPLYAIEETKTDDSESRNTGVYQRCSKFVYIDFFYPGIKKIMLYNLQIPQKTKATQTNIFGTRMLKTIGVEILGKVYDKKIMIPFPNLEELVEAKNSMRMPPVGNVPIKIQISLRHITISGKLYKAGGICHDPNIGALTIIALCIRKWEKTKSIIITNHGLKQEHLGKDNKFIQIASRLNIKLDGLKMPNPDKHKTYWHYENSQEKVATIFLHLMLLVYTNAEIIYENHGGCERGYFLHRYLGPLVIEKYQKGKRKAYKSGNKSVIIHLPDMIVFDPKRNQIINVEGKRYATRKQGIRELKNFLYIENKIIKPSHNPDSIIRTVAVFGSKKTSISERRISFLLNENGEIILGKHSPEIFKEGLKKLLES